MKKLTILAVIVSLLLLCSCETQGVTYDYRDDTVLPPDNIPMNVTRLSNSTPEYIYDVSVLDRDGKTVTESSPLKLKNGKGEMTVEIEYDSNFPSVFGIALLSSYLPIEFTVGKETTFCYKTECAPGEKTSVSLSFEAVSADEYESLKLVLIEDADTVARSLLTSTDFAFSVDIPYTGKTAAGRDNAYTDSNGKIKNLYDVFEYEKLEPDEKKIFDNTVARLKNDALFTAVQTEAKVSFMPMDQPKSITDNECYCYFRATGQAGKYATVIYVNDQPIRAFDGGYTLIWELQDTESILDTEVILPGMEEGIHKVYSLTFPIDTGREKQPVYCSPIRPYFSSAKIWKQSDWNEFTVSVLSENGEYSSFKDMQDTTVNHPGGEIRLRLIHNLPVAYFETEYTVLVLCNGIIQSFNYNGRSVGEIVYTIKEGEGFEADISFLPEIPFETDELNIDVVFIPEFASIYDSELSWNSNGLGYTQHAEINYGGGAIVSTDIAESCVTDSCVKGSFPPTYYSVNDPVRDGDYGYLVNGGTTFRYELHPGTAGRYIMLAFLEGELIPVAGGKKYAYFEFSGKAGECAAFDIDISGREDRESELMILTVSLDSVYDGRYDSGIWFDEIGFIEAREAGGTVGTVTAYSYLADGIIYGCAEFEGSENMNGYIQSTISGFITSSPFSGLRHTNSDTFEGQSFCIDSRSSAVDSTEVNIYQENDLKIYIKTEKGYKVAKYVTGMGDLSDEVFDILYG